MRKLKLFSIVLLLILSVGVLGMGIYAASPATNTVQGKIEIVGSKYPVTIETWIEDLPEGSNGYKIQENLRAGGQTFTYDNLKMDMSKALYLAETNITIAVKVTNLSNTEIGVYFLKEGLTESDIIDKATMSQISTGFEIKASDDADADALINVSVDFYKQLGVKTPENDISDEATLYLTFRATDWIYDDYNEILDNLLEFNYKLVIEKYDADITTQTADFEDFASNSIQRLSSSYGTTKRESITSSTFTNIGTTAVTNISLVLPTSVTQIGDEVFCAQMQGDYATLALVNISMPDTLTSIGDSGFFFCTNLNIGRLPKNLQTLGNCAFVECKIEGLVIPETLETVSGEVFIWPNGELDLKEIYFNAINMNDFSGGAPFGICDNHACEVSVIFGESVAHIPARLFDYSDSYPPNSIYINAMEFKQTTVPVFGTNWINSYSFEVGDYGDFKIIVPEGMADEYKEALPDFLDAYVIERVSD